MPIPNQDGPCQSCVHRHTDISRKCLRKNCEKPHLLKDKLRFATETNYDFPIVDKERAWKILDVMAPIAKAHGCSPARLSIAWLLAKPVVTSVIIGAKRLDQLQDNLAAIELTLTQDELRQLDEV